MLRSDADAPKPPAYPFITNQSQRARTQNTQHTRTSGVPAVLPPDCLAVVFAAAFRCFRSAFPLLFRFGEGAFTSRGSDPQAENDSQMTNFSPDLETLRNLPVFPPI